MIRYLDSIFLINLILNFWQAFQEVWKILANLITRRFRSLIEGATSLSFGFKWFKSISNQNDATRMMGATMNSFVENTAFKTAWPIELLCLQGSTPRLSMTGSRLYVMDQLARLETALTNAPSSWEGIPEPDIESEFYHFSSFAWTLELGLWALSTIACRVLNKNRLLSTCLSPASQAHHKFKRILPTQTLNQR